MLIYLKKYGGVSFKEQPLNDVDRLVFAQMAYVDFPANARRDVPLSEILGQITFEKKEAAEEVRFWFQSKSDRELCTLAAAAKRYADVRFHGFFRSADAAAPFAALSLLLPDGAQLIAFRGTDNTLKGWKEDFDLAVETEIPTQGTAKKLVEAAAQEERLLELCGHSKGGNLALYAAVFAGAQAQKQLRQAVSFDGPGLSAEVMRSVEYRQVSDRLRLVVPQASLVGLLFHQPENVRIVLSSTYSVLQHYPYTWKTDGMDFAEARKLTAPARLIGDTVCGLIEQMPVDMRARFIDAVYGIVCATGAETLNDIVRGWISNTPRVLKKLAGTDMKTYALIARTVMLFWRSAAEAFGLMLTGNDEASEIQR